MSKYNIAYTATAKKDLVGIFEFVADYNYNFAVELRKTLDEKILLLTKSPFLGRPATNLKIAIDNSRITFCKPYIIFYSVDTAQNIIYIESVMHEAQENLDWIY